MGVADMLFHMFTNLGDHLSFINRASRNNKHQVDVVHNQIAPRRRYDGSHSNWHELLPINLMEMILPRLDLIDRIRMSVVCKSWAFILTKEFPIPPQLPWLLLPQAPPNCCKTTTATLNLLDLSQGKLRDLKLPKPVQGGWCCGCSKGWFIIAREKQFQSEIFLFNPMSGVYHKLPSLTTLACFDDNVYHFSNPFNAYNFFMSFELSSTDPSNCTVAAIFDCIRPTLAFCRVGGESWSIFCDGKVSCTAAILFSNETLYLIQISTTTTTNLDEEGGVVVAASYTFKSTDYHVSLKFITYTHVMESDYRLEYENEDFSIYKDYAYFLYLAESINGELLLIRRYVDSFESRYFYVDEEEHESAGDMTSTNDQDNNEDYDDAIFDTDTDYENDDDNEDVNSDIIEDNVDDDDNEEDNNYLKYERTSKFEIYVIDPNTTASCKTRLTSLGNQAVFLSASGSSCIQARDFTGCQENCIYFVDDYSYCKDDRHSNLDYPLVSRESGIFHIDDGRIERSFPSVGLPLHSCMGWFTPNFSF